MTDMENRAATSSGIMDDGRGTAGAPPAQDLLGRTVPFVGAIAAVSLLIGVGVSFKLARSTNWSASGLALLPLLLVLGAGSYLSRFSRWHVLVRQVAPGLRVLSSLRIYMAGFAMGLTPGRVGEFCKFALLREETGVPEAQSVAIFPLERAIEAATFAGLATAGAAFGHFQPARLSMGALLAIVSLPGLALLGMAIRFFLRRSRSRSAGATSQERGPSLVKQVLTGVQAIAGPRPLLLGLAWAIGARCCDMLLFSTALAIAGIHIPLAAAALAFGLAGLTGGFSLLPAGVGAVEASLTATVVALSGASPAAGLLAALLARSVTLWMWIPAGLWFAFRRGVSRLDAGAQPALPIGAPSVVSTKGRAA